MSNHEPEPKAAPHPDGDQPAAVSVSGANSIGPEAGAAEPVSGSEPQTAAGAARPLSGHPISERRRAANRVNAQKSTGPRTDSGKLHSSQNARISIRLLGLAEARTLNQDLNAAGHLYRELIAPYEPAPPLLARQFEDLARLYLELEAWERIRDAQLEDRAEQADIECRQHFMEMDRDLQGTSQEIFDKGLCSRPDSPAKFKRLVDSLSLVKDHLRRRDFDLAALLHYLYGQDLNPPYDRGQTICLECEPLLDPAKRSAVTDEQLERLVSTVEEEEQAALWAYALLLDQKSISRAGRLARLAPTRDDHWMNRHAERLRHDIDRKLKLILNLLAMYGLEELPRYRSRASRRGSGAPEGPSDSGAHAGPDRSSLMNSAPKGRGFNPAVRTRSQRRVSPLPPARRPKATDQRDALHGALGRTEGEGRGVRGQLAFGWAEAQPLSLSGVDPSSPAYAEDELRGGDSQRRAGAIVVQTSSLPSHRRGPQAKLALSSAKGCLHHNSHCFRSASCAQKVSETKPRSPLESTNRCKNGTKRSQPESVVLQTQTCVGLHSQMPYTWRSRFGDAALNRWFPPPQRARPARREFYLDGAYEPQGNNNG